jgi:subtilisin family serine protease
VTLGAGFGLYHWITHRDSETKDSKGIEKKVPPSIYSSPIDDDEGDPRSADFVPGECIIQYRSNVTAEQKAAVRDRFKAELKEDLRYAGTRSSKAAAQPGGTELVTLDLGIQGQALSKNEIEKRQLAQIDKLNNDPNILTAEPNYFIHKADDHFYANDPYYIQGKTWGVKTAGLNSVARASDPRRKVTRPVATSLHASDLSARSAASASKPKVASSSKSQRASTAHVEASQRSLDSSAYSTHADKAWAAGHVGSKSVFVAIVDSGFQANHPDLAPNVWGQIGQDFYNPDNPQLFASDEDPHGTHVAGIIAGVGGNSVGIAGVMWKATIIEAKFLGSDGTGDTASAIQAIRWITDLRKSKNLNIVAINASWTSSRKSPALLAAIKDAGRNGILLVAAAGNDHLNSDSKYKSYPAGYDTEHDTYDKTPSLAFNSVISVAAIAPDGSLAPFSNYGAHSVQIAAPGVDIWSTWTRSSYKADSGTSMAAPFVTGGVALFASSHPRATAEEIRRAILSSATRDPALVGKVASGGTLNLSSF